MLESILRFSVDRRWLVVLLTLIAGAVGVWSLTRLPIDAVPDITNNQVQINALAPALSPVEVERQVTFPIETSLAGIPGLQSTRSISRNGFAQVTAIFDDNVDVYFARQQVSERLRDAGEALPSGVQPSMGPISTGLGEVFMYVVEYADADAPYRTPEGETLTDDVERAAYLRTVQDWIIRPQLRHVPGVAGVDSIGGYEKVYAVEADPTRLRSFGLSFADVVAALERNNVSAGAGFIERNGEAYNVRVAGRLSSADELADVVIAAPGGTPIRIRDVATVVTGGALRTGAASVDGREAVVGTVLMRIGENSRTVADAVARRMEDVQRSLPPGITARSVLDRTTLVNDTISTVRTNLVEGAVFVIAVLFIMLGNFRAALITALAIPLSMLLTASGMLGAGISGNLLSLGAIDFGIIVDGSVIIVENCLRRLAERQHELGRPLTLRERLETVFAASKQVRSATAFGEAIIITVYIPILALTGVEGKMFHPMAATVIFALVGAFILSLTFIPAMVAIGMGGRIREREVFFVRWAKAAYAPVVVVAMRLRWAVVAVAVIAFASSAWLFTRLGQEFIPTLDEGNIAMHAMRIASTGIEQSATMQLDVERAVAAFPEVAVVFSKTGTAEVASDPMPPNVSDTFIILKPTDQWRSEAELDRLIAARAAHAEDDHGHGEEEDGHAHGPPPTGHRGKLVKLLELTLAEVPGNNYEFTQPIQMRFNELIAGVRGDVAVKVFGEDFDAMRATADRIAAVLSSTPGSADVKVEQTDGLPMLTVTPDRAAIARLGLSAADVQDALTIAVGGREAGQIFEGDRRFDVVVRLPEHARANLGQLRDLPIPLPDQAGAFIPLSRVAAIDIAEGPNQVSRENGQRRVVVQANVRGRDLGSFVEEAQAAIAREIALPPGAWLDWGGQFENLANAKARLSIVVPACFFLILLLLYGTFGTVRDALMVFTCVPLALTGGVLALWLRGMPFSISAAVGFIALSGVAVLNGLVVVTFIKQLRRDGLDVETAIARGAVVRLRPVLMTALVAALGFVPMALSTGRGAEVQKPLATVVIGGIVSATLLTLVVLPAVYRIVHGRGARPVE